MSQPFLSVIIATHNRRNLLRAGLEALARQSYPASEFEVLVVSDGSTDGTDQLAIEYQARIPYHLRLLSQENSGPSRARNSGVAQAVGEVVLFMDDDLEPWPEFLSAHAEHHRRNTHLAVIGPSLPDPARRSQEPPWIAWDHAMLQKQYVGWAERTRPDPGPTNFYTGNASVRRTHVLAVGGFNEAMRRQEDVDLGQRMADSQGLAFLFEPRAAGFHRPDRSFASWERIPYGYGRLDVIRARSGELSWERVHHSYHSRNAVTRALAQVVLHCPTLAGPISRCLLCGAHAAFGAGAAGLSVRTLSAIYNLRYLEGARDELGGLSAIRRLLWEPEAHLASQATRVPTLD